MSVSEVAAAGSKRLTFVSNVNKDRY